MGTDIRLTISSASFSALLYAEMMTTGWMSSSSWDRDWARISPARLRDKKVTNDHE